MTYEYDYPRPMVTVDVAVFAGPRDARQLLLIRRGREPFRGKWALPGGFIDMDENLEPAAKRELREETGMAGVEIEEIGAFGDVGRDPRGRTIAIAYLAVIDEPARVEGGDDADEAKWFDVNDLPDLAFDHDKIIRAALRMMG